MEIIELPGYLQYDKREIARRHIIPKQLAEHGLEKLNILFPDEAIDKVIVEYTKEAGVRNVEREIATICRKVAKDIVLGENGLQRKKGTKKKAPPPPFPVTPARVEEYLGVPRFRNRKRRGEARVGSVTGLAWTSVGGEILNVDVTVMDGRDRLTLTGQLGDVMKESAQAALSYLRSQEKALRLPRAFTKGKEIHIHLPEGAIPKDGPSAGITMAMALYSAVSGRPARSDVAMTGEITLRGEVLAIGGLNEKLIAAQRSGMTTVLIPEENVKDLKEIAAPVKEGLTIVPISRIEDALPHVFASRARRRRSR
jgi:ATP-dependent Lon protease